MLWAVGWPTSFLLDLRSASPKKNSYLLHQSGKEPVAKKSIGSRGGLTLCIFLSGHVIFFILIFFTFYFIYTN